LEVTFHIGHSLQTLIRVSSVGSLSKNMHKHFKLPIKTVKTVYSFVRKAKMARATVMDSK